MIVAKIMDLVQAFLDYSDFEWCVDENYQELVFLSRRLPVKVFLLSFCYYMLVQSIRDYSSSMRFQSDFGRVFDLECQWPVALIQQPHPDFH